MLARLALQRCRQVRLDGRQYCLEAFGVAGNDVAFFKEIVTAGEVAHQAARFLDQQHARKDGLGALGGPPRQQRATDRARPSRAASRVRRSRRRCPGCRESPRSTPPCRPTSARGNKPPGADRAACSEKRSALPQQGNPAGRKGRAMRRHLAAMLLAAVPAAAAAQTGAA